MSVSDCSDEDATERVLCKDVLNIKSEFSDDNLASQLVLEIRPIM
jgi:hypothetical protein